MRTCEWMLLCGSTIVVLTGCCSLSPNVDKRFGEATSLAKANQIVNLDAGHNQAVPKLDGVAATEAVERYKASFKNPPPPTNIFNIGIGSGTSR